MAIGHETWTVLPHDPIEKLAENLWRVEGMIKGNRRTMVLGRLGDGRIVMHNAMALDDASMSQIDAWGNVAAIVIPNRFHRLDAAIVQQRYPNAKVYAPRGVLGPASKATPCAGGYGDVPSDERITLRELQGVRENEGVMLVKSNDGVTAVFCDMLLNLPKRSGLAGFALHPTGTLSIPRAMRWMTVKKKQAVIDDFESIANIDGLVRLIPGHGDVISVDVARELRTAARRLR